MRFRSLVFILAVLIALGVTLGGWKWEDRGHAAQAAPQGFLLGVQVQPRKIAALAYDVGIHDANELVIAVAVCLSESQGFDRAYNDNVDESGQVISRDVGMYQINIPASKIGTQVEADLYDRANNVAAMYRLYQARGWQPWAAYNSNVFLNDSYIQRAALGVQNYLAERLVVRAKSVGKIPATRVPMVTSRELLALYR